MQKYNVIWFDDQFDTLNIIREEAHLAGISLVGFSDAQSGLHELEKNSHLYDAALVDGNFFIKPGLNSDQVSDEALDIVAKAFLRLETKKIIPWFILSGQANFTKGGNKYADVYKNGEVFDKINESSRQELWNKIKEAANHQPDTQLRHKYRMIFELCDENYLGIHMSETLMGLIHLLKDDSEVEQGLQSWNTIRKVIERCFIVLNRIGLIPDEINRTSGSINGSGLFLAGKHSDFRLKKEIAPPVINFMIHNLLELTQDGSHSKEELKLKVDLFVKNQPTGFLFKSSIYQLLEILIWLKSIIDTYPSIDDNKNLIELRSVSNTAIYEGEIEQDERKNFHCGEYLLNFRLVNESYKVGDIIRILDFTSNNNSRTNIFYSKFATKFIKIT
ncbi:MAG TPA: hypothetical protein VFW78_03585 [Bacteroidia bacterium]|nr:hypothetical protein [Bacteroidia bacterium]